MIELESLQSHSKPPLPSKNIDALHLEAAEWPFMFVGVIITIL